MPMVPVSEWKPDLSANLGDQQATNVIPDVDSYRPWPSLTTYTGSLSATSQGAFAAKDKTGVCYDFAGTANKLYSLAGTVWNDVSRVTASATYATAPTDWWEFVQWNETVIGVNGAALPQEITLGAATFTDLAGAPPVAKHIAIVKDFVFLGDLFPSGFRNRVRWCAINNTHSWTVDATTLSDFQDFPGDGGYVQKIVGGNEALIFLERQIWRGVYAGSPQIFDFGNGPIERDVGALAAQSVAYYGPVVFWLSERGFRAMIGGQVIPIGANKVDRTFFADFDQAYIHRAHGVIDPANKLYMLAYPGAGNNGGTPNKIMIYNWVAQKWAVVSEEIEMFFRSISTGYTLDGLDAITTNLDLLPDSLDSAAWLGGLITLAAFRIDNRLNLFSGTAKNALVDTVEVEHIPGRRSQVTRVRPVVEGGATASITPITRDRVASAPMVGTTSTQLSNGDCAIRASAFYHRYRIQTAAEDFDHIRGAMPVEINDRGKMGQT